MACPYFDPGERRPGWSGSLGDLYTGLCRADAGSAWLPDEQTVQDRCNLGYARGRCAHFPSADGPDAVRFSVAKHEAAGIRILYSIERDHRPHTNGALEYSTDAGAFVGLLPGGALERLAAAYVRSYLRRVDVGQVGNLRPIGNRLLAVSTTSKEADCQSAAGFQPAPHEK